MISIFQAFLMAVGAVVLALASVLLGGWIVFKSKAAPHERFIGPSPKGEAFTVADAATAPDEVDGVADKKLLERTEQFLTMLGGKK